MKIYRCNNGDCRAEVGELDSWLTIGAEGEKTLHIRNNTGFRGLIEMGRHDPIHFCSAKCFIKFLFGDDLIVSKKEKSGEEAITEGNK